MSAKYTCTKSRRPVEPTYKTIHKIDDNVLSVKLNKDKHRIESTAEYTTESISSRDVECVDKHSKVSY